ncbi:MAG TPA: diaminopimelate decarboxylase [Acidobacteriota bacterium]|nr:diaminopimelate decarboxylase [Acidobacteriota bacterium]
MTIAGHDATELARAHGTPLYVYDSARMEANLGRLRQALDYAGVRHQLLYALKCNRHPDIVARMRETGVGVDVCSPNEMDMALAAGWEAEDISYTGTNLSSRDLERILAHPVILNLDSMSAIRNVGARAPGRSIGLRLNPGVGTYSTRTTAAGTWPSKFGIYPEQLDEALAIAAAEGLQVRGLHFHIGSGWLQEKLDEFRQAVQVVGDVATRLTDLEYVNVGGGIGVPGVASAVGVDLGAYAALISKSFGSLGVRIMCEPGDFLARDSGIFLVEVVGVDERRGVRFVGVDGGYNACGIPYLYREPQEIVVCRAADAPATETYTVAGHINEARDVFADEMRLPEVHEGDILALLNVGGYGAELATIHCARPHAERLVL